MSALLLPSIARDASLIAIPTLAEARKLLADALREYLLSLAESPSTAAGQNGAVHCEPPVTPA